MSDISTSRAETARVSDFDWVHRLSAIVGAGLVLAACQVAPNLPPAPLSPAVSDGAAAGTPGYKIQVGDILDIKVFETPELNEEITVRPDGDISTTLVKNEHAAGRTVAELADSLQNDYKQFVKIPTLNVLVKTFSPDRIYVGGEVAQPGEFVTIPPNLTLVQAISRAGGMKLTGDQDKVVILRRGAGDTPIVYRANFADARSGRDPAADVRLANFDIVFVPRTAISEVYLFWNQYLQQFVPVSWGFSYVFNSSSSVVHQ